jgi:hypothetical protein
MNISKKRQFNNGFLNLPPNKLQNINLTSPVEEINELRSLSKLLYPGYDVHWEEIFNAFFSAYVSCMGVLPVKVSYMTWIIDSCPMEVHHCKYMKFKVNEGCSLEYFYRLLRIYIDDSPPFGSNWISCFFSTSIPLINEN